MSDASDIHAPDRLGFSRLRSPKDLAMLIAVVCVLAFVVHLVAARPPAERSARIPSSFGLLR